jgi:Lon protease-like protein
MALLEPNWYDDYEGRPPIAPVACLGRVLTWQAQEGSRYNILLLGVRRVRIVRELPPERTFRTAEVELVADDYPLAAAPKRPALQRQLIKAFQAALPRMKDAAELFNQLSVNNISLGALADVISYALDLDIREKQKLLAEPNVDRRCRQLLAHLRMADAEACGVGAAGGFPPPFSAN